MKNDIYRARNEARKILDRSAKTEIVQLISSMTGTSQAEIIKNADKIKLSDILELELVQDAYFTWEMWRDLQLATPDVNLT